MNLYKPVELVLNEIFLCHFPPLLVGDIPATGQKKKENQLLLWAACRASSFLSSGKASFTMIKLIFGNPHTDKFHLSFLYSNYLGCIRTLGWPDNALSEPGI